MSTNVHLQRTGLRYSSYNQGLTKGQLRALVGGIVFIHLVAGWGLLQIRAVREAVLDTAPMFFEVIAEPAPIPPAPPSQPKPIPKIVSSAPLISTPAQSASSVVTEPPEPEVPVEVAEPAMIQAPPAPSAPPPPKMIPASAIQYVVPPQMEYPRASRPFREAGRVITRVYVDETGMPRAVQISKSSGFPRLDEAGIRAVQKARFKPYTENGLPAAGWALIPLNFELE